MPRNAPAKDKANRRGAARLAAVQALYQMDLAGTGLNDICRPKPPSSAILCPAWCASSARSIH
jgi:hypothetical protein